MKKIAVLICLLYTFLTVSCSRSMSVVSINQKELFRLNWGNFEDELNLFNLSESGPVNTYFTMRDGFFYIANGESKKILELNSYGDLLSLYYNPEVTHTASFAPSAEVRSTKKAVAYQFNTLGPVCVDSRRWIYAVDTFPPERQETDSENGEPLLLSNVVLRFDTQGNFVDYIGQQGPGGAPFPHIKSIYTTQNNELVVVCMSNEGFIVYWYNTSGFQMYKIPVSTKNVPSLPDRKDDDPELYLSVENIIPDSVDKKLYLKVDYSEVYLDPDVKLQSGMVYLKTILYPLSAETGRYEGGIEIPGYEETETSSLGSQLHNIPFEFLGVTDNGWFFFVVPVEKGLLVQMVQPNGQRFIKRLFEMDHNQILYYSMFISGNGIVSALFAEREYARVVLWRTDSLINSILD